MKAVRGGGVKRGDVCYGMLRTAACVDESDHHTLMYVFRNPESESRIRFLPNGFFARPSQKEPYGHSREIGVYWYLFSNHYTRKCIHKK